MRQAGLSVATLNVRSLNGTGSATLLVKEMVRYHIEMMGLQEIRWTGQGEMIVDEAHVLWSGRQDEIREQGVGLVVSKTLAHSLVSWKAISERLMQARFRHLHGYMSILVTYAPTEGSIVVAKDAFYARLEEAIVIRRRHLSKNIIKVVAVIL